jgi:hypothetical protein
MYSKPKSSGGGVFAAGGGGLLLVIIVILRVAKGCAVHERQQNRRDGCGANVPVPAQVQQAEASDRVVVKE